MPLVLKFTPEGKQRDGRFVGTGKVNVEVWDNEIQKDSIKADPNNVTARHRISKHGVDGPTTLKLLNTAIQTGERQTHTLSAPEDTPADDIEVTIREITATTGPKVTGMSAVLDAVSTTPRTQVLTWVKEEDRLGCLDVDYHDPELPPPTRMNLEAWMENTLSPKPHLWHFSKGGGIHAFYTPAHGVSGRELASCAALHFAAIDPTCKVELKRQIKGAGDERVYRRATQDLPDALLSWAGAPVVIEGPKVTKWLEDHGMEPGGRYDHDKCPIEPSNSATRMGTVRVGEGGVYCHACADKGTKRFYGSRIPGFVSWGVLVGDTRASDLHLMVQNLVHWGHARWVLVHKYGLSESLARDAYSAALKLSHPNDPRIDAVFEKDLLKLTRSNNTWMNLDEDYEYPGNNINPLVSAMPHCLRVDEEGKVASKRTTVSYMTQGHSLDDRGFENVERIHGFRFAERWLPNALPHTLAAVPTFGVPKYKIGDVAKAEKAFERYFPEADWRLIRLLMVAAGNAQETRLGQHPMIFIEGVTGSGKSTHPRLASGMMGCDVNEVPFHRDPDKFKQHVKEGARKSAIVVCNEVLKEAEVTMRGSFDVKLALNPILTMTPEASVWKLYSGPRKLGRLPAFLLTEPRCPRGLKRHDQLARRLWFYQLTGEKFMWKETIAALGINAESAHKFRLHSRELADAADVILGDIVNEFFSLPMTFDKAAEMLGVKTVRDSPEFDDVTPELRRLYALVCAAPDLTNADELRKHKAGYKKIHRTDGVTEIDKALRDVYTQFSEENTWVSAKALEEKDWNRILKYTGPTIHMDRKIDGQSTVFIRFRQGTNSEPTAVNGEIIDLSSEIKDVIP